MEDTSYVSLSLEKYNELYDKAKNYDQLTEKLTDEVSENIRKIFDGINEMIAADEEHSGETEEVEDTEFKVGDKVKLVKLNDCTNGFNIGDICTITSLSEISMYYIEIDNGISKGYVNEENIKKLRRKNNYEF